MKMVIEQNFGDQIHTQKVKVFLDLQLATDVTDATHGASGLCQGTRTGAGGTATLTESFFGRNPRLHGQLGNSIMIMSLSSK